MKLLICILIVPLFCSSQTDWEKVEPQVFLELIRGYEQSVPEGDHYSIETGYRIYSNATDQVPVQVFDGKLICKSGKMLNLFQMGHILVQDEQLNVTVDTAGKKILLQKPDPSFFYRKTVKDYTTFLETADVVQRRKQGDQVLYRLMLKKGAAYDAMDFLVSGKFTITQITIYTNQPYYTEDDTYSSDKARIVLDFRNFKTGKAVELKKFLLVKDFIAFKDKTPVPVGNYSDYEVIDLRN